MRFRIPQLQMAIIPLLMVFAAADQLSAQSGCARCAQPNIRPQNGPTNSNVATRFRPAEKRFNEIFDAQTDDEPATNKYQPTTPRKPRTPALVPTELVVPSESVPANEQPVAAPSKPSIADKISLRYSDPRVLRMLQQLTPQSAEAFYLEVSQLIDGRHISPATYTRRVDGAIDHLVQALDVPSFQEAAQLKGSPAAIAGLQDNLRQLKTNNRSRNTSDAVAVLRNVQRMAAKSVSINPSAVSLEFLYGATDSLDQFSMLLPPEKVGGPSVGLRDNVVGIGVEVEPHPSGLRIVKLISGGPAAQADLRKGDVITHADGNDLKDLDLNSAVDFIVGPVGSPIQIEATRDGRVGQVTLTRQRIAVHSVTDVHMADRSQGVAYLKLEQFSESTMDEVDTALMNLHQQGMQSLIMDLRGNPGGLLTTAIALSDRFLPSGTIVSTRGRTPDDDSVELAHYANTWRVPLVVLIDHNSASASEIFAAAIQENHRGVIVGERSYGKGTVQTLFPLQTVSAGLRLTTAKFYSPDGREMAGAGVTPDVNVASDANTNRKNDAVLNEGLRQATDSRVKDLARQPNRRMGETIDESRVAA